MRVFTAAVLFGVVPDSKTEICGCYFRVIFSDAFIAIEIACADFVVPTHSYWT